MSKATMIQQPTYTTAEFRKRMADAFEIARYGDDGTGVSVVRHGKPWVSVVSPKDGDFIKQIHGIGDVTVAELKSVVSSLSAERSISITNFLNQIHQIKTSESNRSRGGYISESGLEDR